MPINADATKLIGKTPTVCFAHWLCCPVLNLPGDMRAAAAQAHDKCYDKNGYFNCDCDKNILECLQGVFISNGPRREDQNAFKTAAMLYFRNAPCRSSGGSWSFFRWLQNLG
jgi:hypothetical protein